MRPIEAFIEDERSAMSWYDKLVGNYPKVKSTNEVAGRIALKPGEVTRLTRTVALTITTIITVVVIIPFIYIMFTVGNVGNESNFIISIPAAVFVFAGLFFLWYKFFNKKYVSSLSVSHLGITVDDQEIVWKEIAETAIMYRRERRRETLHLIIFHKSGNISRHNLYNFWMWDKKLAGIIEYYKPKQTVSA